MADRMISDFNTLSAAEDADKILICANNTTYCITFATLKRDSKGDTGPQGPTGNGIANITQNQDNTLTITMTDGTTYSVNAVQGATGPQGPTGPCPNFSIGTVQTLPAGQPATATITGTAENPVLNLGLPISNIDLTDYYTKTQVDNLLAGYATVQNFSVTIPTTGWTQYQSTLYKNTVTVQGILSSDTNDIISLQQTGTETTDEQLREAYDTITRIAAATNAIDVYATAIPSVAIPIAIKVIR